MVKKKTFEFWIGIINVTIGLLCYAGLNFINDFPLKLGIGGLYPLIIGVWCLADWDWRTKEW